MWDIENSEGGHTPEVLGLTNSCQVVFSLPLQHTACFRVSVQTSPLIPMLNTSGMTAACLIISSVQMKDHFGKLSNLAGSSRSVLSGRWISDNVKKHTHTQSINHESTGDCSSAQSKIKSSNLCIYIYIYVCLYSLSLVYPWISPHFSREFLTFLLILWWISSRSMILSWKGPPPGPCRCSRSKVGDRFRKSWKSMDLMD